MAGDDLYSRHGNGFGRMPNGDPDYVFRGFYVSNSEVGRRSFVLAGFYLRGTCENRILWGVEGFQEVTMRHSKYAPDRFIEEIRPALAATNRLTPPRPGTDEHKAWSAVHRAPPGPDRWRFRSSTFDGIADAMADQWSKTGDLLLRCGEMTAQELRTAKAVANGIAATDGGGEI